MVSTSYGYMLILESYPRMLAGMASDFTGIPRRANPYCSVTSADGAAMDSPDKNAIGFSDAVLEDTIYGPGISHDTAAKNVEDPGAKSQGSQVLPAPKERSVDEYGRHGTTRLKYDSRCECCIAARRPDTQPQQSAPDRQIPALHSGYCSLRDFMSEDLSTVPVMHLA